MVMVTALQITIFNHVPRYDRWLEDGGLMVATSALGTGVDFEGIVFILHVGMPWSMIDYAQESGRGGRAGERVDSVILAELGAVKRTMKQKSEDLDVQAMGAFLLSSGCRRGLMSGYLDGRSVGCEEAEAARCDRCGEGVDEWMSAQQEISAEWQRVRETMDKLRDGCAMCWVMETAVRGREGTEWQGHRTMQCTVFEDLGGEGLDAFRRGVRDQGDCHSCRRCWVSQRYCATGEDVRNKCQWPNVIMAIAFAAVRVTQGIRTVEQCGFKETEVEECEQTNRRYQQWLGQRHGKRVWGEYFSNAMVVGIRIMLKFGEQRQSV
jgi:superfamily II DNA helicase RecQ